MHYDLSVLSMCDGFPKSLGGWVCGWVGGWVGGGWVGGCGLYPHCLNFAEPLKANVDTVVLCTNRTVVQITNTTIKTLDYRLQI